MKPVEKGIVMAMIGFVLLMALGCRNADRRSIPKFEITCISPIRVDTVVDARVTTTKENIVFYHFADMVAVYPSSCIVKQLSN